MTTQIKEILILNGKKTIMLSEPDIPVDSEFIEDLLKEDGIESLPDKFKFSDCWRRYLGTWEIKGDKLFLIDIEGSYRKNNKEPIFADWYSGTIIVPQGRLLKNIHLGYKQIYEEEIQIEIEQGFVQSIAVIDNRGKKDVSNFKIWDWRKLE
ncbi:MAG: hypothetical protein V1779_08040 [bacterium]